METRVAFKDELRELEERALEGLDMVVTQLGRAMEALEHHDVELAELVVVEDDRIDGRYLEVHQGICRCSRVSPQLPLTCASWPRCST